MATTPHGRGRRAQRFVGLGFLSLYSKPVPLLDPPDEAVPGSVEPWEATAPVRPDTDFVRAPRFLDVSGEIVSAFMIIAGGVFAYGFLRVG